MEEIRKDITGYEGLYQVSDRGQVRRLDSILPRRGGFKLRKGRILKQSRSGAKATTKYYSLGLYKSNIGVRFLVHRLVATAFIENSLNKPCVNHKDGNGFNNNIDNLERCTYSENETYSYKVLGKKPNKTGLGKFGKLNHKSKKVLQIEIRNDKIVRERDSMNEAGRAGFNIGGISSCCRGLYKFSQGYKRIFATSERK